MAFRACTLSCSCAAPWGSLLGWMGSLAVQGEGRQAVMWAACTCLVLGGIMQLTATHITPPCCYCHVARVSPVLNVVASIRHVIAVLLPCYCHVTTHATAVQSHMLLPRYCPSGGRAAQPKGPDPVPGRLPHPASRVGICRVSDRVRRPAASLLCV